MPPRLCGRSLRSALRNCGWRTVALLFFGVHVWEWTLRSVEGSHRSVLWLLNIWLLLERTFQQVLLHKHKSLSDQVLMNEAAAAHFPMLLFPKLDAVFIWKCSKFFIHTCALVFQEMRAENIYTIVFIFILWYKLLGQIEFAFGCFSCFKLPPQHSNISHPTFCIYYGFFSLLLFMEVQRGHKTVLGII